MGAVKGRRADALRRVIDLLAAAVCGIVLSPVIVAVALSVRLRLGSPVIFRQLRLGRGGASFEFYKFRTMAAPQIGREAPRYDGERLTSFGRLLRSASLDELPSFVNLLRGDVTLVGPRPLPVHYWPRFTVEQLRRFEVKPGITGLAQISGRNSVTWQQRLSTDLEYIERRSLRLDLQILWRTIPVVFGRRGVDQSVAITMPELPESSPRNDTSRRPDDAVRP